MAGGIPLIRPLRESLVGERITRVLGIVNGTTNYILTRMTEAGATYADALAEAQAPRLRRGATPPPTSRATTPAPRSAIIASIAFGAAVVAGDVHLEGITGITDVDIAFAKRMGYVIKLLGVADQLADRARSACGCTRPWSPSTTRWPRVRESFNAVFVEGAAVGDLMFYGRGAGGSPDGQRRARRPHRRRHQPAQGLPRRRSGSWARPRSAPSTTSSRRST